MLHTMEKTGYIFLDFNNLEHLSSIQDVIRSLFPCEPTHFHDIAISEEERLQLVKRVKDEIIKKKLVKQLLVDNSDLLIHLLGPDIDIQSDIYLRVSRPNRESDFIDWHRDTFYGNTYWELNFWFPVFPLAEGAGMMIIDGSHLNSSHAYSVPEMDPFRKQVTKGSLANELGYLYAPKTDEVISARDSSKIKLLTPQWGKAILFFAHAAHRAHNASPLTRVSIDLRIKSMLAPTNTKAGYYQPLTRGIISSYVEKLT